MRIINGKIVSTTLAALKLCPLPTQTENNWASYNDLGMESSLISMRHCRLLAFYLLTFVILFRFFSCELILPSTAKKRTKLIPKLNQKQKETDRPLMSSDLQL